MPARPSRCGASRSATVARSSVARSAGIRVTRSWCGRSAGGVSVPRATRTTRLPGCSRRRAARVAPMPPVPPSTRWMPGAAERTADVRELGAWTGWRVRCHQKPSRRAVAGSVIVSSRSRSGRCAAQSAGRGPGRSIQRRDTSSSCRGTSSEAASSPASGMYTEPVTGCAPWDNSQARGRTASGTSARARASAATESRQANWAASRACSSRLPSSASGNACSQSTPGPVSPVNCSSSAVSCPESAGSAS